MEQEKFTIEDDAPVYFENEGKKYVYDFRLLKVIQAENAKEVAEFKHYQMMKDAATFRDIVQSRANEWLMICLSYLLTPVINDAAKPFDEGGVKDAEMFVKNLPLSELEKIEECIRHFFTGIGKSAIISQILQGRGNLLWKQALLGTALNATSRK